MLFLYKRIKLTKEPVLYKKKYFNAFVDFAKLELKMFEEFDENILWSDVIVDGDQASLALTGFVNNYLFRFPLVQAKFGRIRYLSENQSWSLICVLHLKM